jgi:molecular chaperone DnaK (HSP70)
MHDTIAIDFGTMRTKMAYIDPNRNTVELMRIGQDDRPYILSEFFLGRDGIRLFGDDAVEHLDSDPLAFLPRPLKRELRGEWVRAGNRQKATPIELLSLMFQGLRNRTKELPHFRDIPPTGLSLTIPAQYGAKDKEILARAAINAGFSEEKIAFISEPIAAAQAWLRELGGQEEYVTVLDCGGGTLDWACLRRLTDNTFELIAEIPAGGDI